MQDISRSDFEIIASFIEPGMRVLDVGCGDGTLLSQLETTKNVDARGIELSQKGVNECVARGLSVIQGDADHDLVQYPDKAFDVAILSKTIQATRDPKTVMEELTRVGKRVIVSFPNFGYWRVRLSLALFGKMPVTRNLPYTWYNTPNLHFCTIEDFQELCEAIPLKVERKHALRRDGSVITWPSQWLWNLCAQDAIFVVSNKT